MKRLVVGAPFILLTALMCSGCFQTAEKKGDQLIQRDEPSGKESSVQVGGETKQNQNQKLTDGSSPGSVVSSGDAVSKDNSSSVAVKQVVNESGGGSSEQTPSAGQSISANTEVEATSSYIAKLNQLQTYYSGQLNTLYSGAISEYKSNKLSARSIYDRYSSRAMQLREECEAQVNQVLFTLKDQLQSQGQSTAIVEQLRNDFYQQLEGQKATYLSRAKKELGL